MQATVGSSVCLKDPIVGWIEGVVVKVQGAELKVLCSSGKMVSQLPNQDTLQFCLRPSFTLKVPQRFDELICLYLLVSL